MIDPEDRWLSGFTLGEQIRTGCTWDEAVRRAIEFKAEQERLAEEDESE